MSKFDWVIVEGGGVADRFDTEAEALAALPDYPDGARVEFDPFDHDGNRITPEWEADR